MSLNSALSTKHEKINSKYVNPIFLHQDICIYIYIYIYI